MNCFITQILPTANIPELQRPVCAKQVWRIHGLIRLYVGYMLFTLSDAMNPVKSTISFNQWYIIYYSDLQVWETAQRSWSSSVTDLTKPTVQPYLASGGGGSNLGVTASGTGDQDDLVAEVATRIAQIPKVFCPSGLFGSHEMYKALTFRLGMQLYPFLFNHRLIRDSQHLQQRSAAASDQDWASFERYLNFIPLNPSMNSVGRMYATYGLAGVVCLLQPAPMCCSRKMVVAQRGAKADVDAGDDADSVDPRLLRGVVSSASMLHIDRRTFVHRLCTGLELHFPVSSNVRDLISKFSRSPTGSNSSSRSQPRNTWMLRTILSRLWNFYQ